MDNILFYVNKMEIILISSPEILTFNKGKVFAEFKFDDNWLGVKTALFNVDGVTYPMIISDDGICEIPTECYQTRSYQFNVGCICGDLLTSNKVNVKFNESCYVENTSISEPTEDIYNQLIEKINELQETIDNLDGSGSSGNSNSGTTDYHITNKFSYVFELPDYNSDGGITNGQCIVKTTNVNEFVDIPFGGIIKSNNEFYTPSQVLTNEDGHIIFSELFYNACNEVGFSAFFSLVSGESWQAGMILRVILASPSATEADKHALTSTLKGNNDVIVMGEEYFTAANVQNNANLSKVALAQDIWSKAVINGETYMRNGYTVHFQFRGEWVGATVKFDTALTNLTAIFNMKKFYNVETGAVVPMLSQ